MSSIYRSPLVYVSKKLLHVIVCPFEVAQYYLLHEMIGTASPCHLLSVLVSQGTKANY
jgi:hypothetical protein